MIVSSTSAVGGVKIRSVNVGWLAWKASGEA